MKVPFEQDFNEGIGCVTLCGKNISAGINSQGSCQGRTIPGMFQEGFVAAQREQDKGSRR